MLSWLKDLVSPIHMEDARFGAMRYLRDAGIWEGKTLFGPIQREVELLIRGEAGGPSAEQRAFFEMVERRYESLWPLIENKLAAEAKSIGAPAGSFELVGVSVPPEPHGTAEWELSYEAPPSSWHFTVEMEGWVPRGIVAEC